MGRSTDKAGDCSSRDGQNMKVTIVCHRCEHFERKLIVLNRRPYCKKHDRLEENYGKVIAKCPDFIRKIEKVL